MKKVILGLVVSALLIYLSVRGTDFQGLRTALTQIAYGYVLVFLFFVLIMHLLRAWRWGLILTPLEKILPLPLFAMTSVGFLAITALPARLGELGRPYLVSRNSSIKMSAALGTVFVERILDGVAILSIASLVPFFTILPPWLIKTNAIFFLINLIIVAGVLIAVFRRGWLGKLLNLFAGIFPEKWERTLNQLFHHFLDGFGIIGKGKQLIQILLLSLMIWLVNVLAIYFLLLAFDFNLPPAAPFVLMLILIIGIAIPAAPGFIGNWHFAIVLGLGLFGIAKTEALSFAIVYHFLSVSFTALLGLAFIPYLNFSFTEMWRKVKDPYGRISRKRIYRKNR